MSEWSPSPAWIGGLGVSEHPASLAEFAQRNGRALPGAGQRVVFAASRQGAFGADFGVALRSSRPLLALPSFAPGPR